MRNDRELWAVFGLPPGADSRDLKRAYRQLTKRYHPDSSNDPATAKRFSRLVSAYRILSSKAAPAPESLRDGMRTDAEEEDLFALGTAFTLSKDASDRTQAVKRLGLSGKKSAYLFLRKALYDDSPDVAAQAVRSVAFLGIRQADGEIASLFSRADAELKRSILETARSTREPVFLTALKAAQSDPDEEIAAQASEALEAIRRV